jgi:stearoyl-CoA desaturase (delta-9 desaturase)
MGLNHLLSLVALAYLILPQYHVQASTILFAIFLFVFGQVIGVTAGLHRLFSHRSYQAHFILRFVLMIGTSVANQGSIWHWVRDHRVHHAHSDTEADPHDANRGFFFSHIGWLLLKKHRAVIEAGGKIDISDLKRDPLIMFQKRFDPWWNFTCCFVFPTVIAVQKLGEDPLTAFLIVGVLRYVLALHATWCVNSVVHSMEDHHPYAEHDCTSESRLVALITLGEGWHNYHHTFDWDYACAELGASQQFNPTKMFIDAMALIGLVGRRKRADKVWRDRKIRIQEKKGSEYEMVESLNGPPFFKVREITWRVKDDSDLVSTNACSDSDTCTSFSD